MGSTVTGWWARVQAWRRARPFAAGVCTIAAGLVLLAPPYAALQIGQVSIALQTLGGSASLVLGLALIACGLAMWTRPGSWPAPWLTLVLALAAVPAANLGALLIGTSLGMVGFALAVAWAPAPVADPAPEQPDAGPAQAEPRTEPIAMVGGHR
ncbi:DUF6114 domain-containing protein [Saccharopolyspora griseoalba]|uniref:DUF6114 domain-containing protein n=1 Tax=Saccharopolyspora griseoalba TaxID=1431848 RepID=A0ABW2LPR4_9PSEU